MLFYMTKQVRIGKSDLYVNPVGLGTNAVGGHNIFPDIDEEAGKQVVRTAIDNGIDFLDTAYLYGMGRSEELIGEIVKESGKRHELIIATKVSQKIVDGQMTNDNSPSFLKAEVEKSLQRLQTDYIDLLYIHYPDETTPKDEAIGALKQLKDEGKIRAIGVSNFSLDQLKEANKDGYVDVFQGGYNLLDREAEKTYFPYVVEQDISFVPYFPLASGLLTGKYNKDTTIPDSRKRSRFFKEGVYEKNLEKIDQLREIAHDKNVEVAHLVLAWYLTRDAIDAIIPGAKRAEQVLHNLKTLDVKLTNEEIEKIDSIFS